MAVFWYSSPSHTVCHPSTRLPNILGRRLPKHPSGGGHMSAAEGAFISTTRACTIVMAMSSEWVSTHCSVLSQTRPVMSYFAGPNELSVRDASLIHSVLGQGGLPKGPRKCKVQRPQPVAHA